MRLLWHETAWDDYLWWQTQDKKTIRRINLLIRDIQRSPFDGIGKPEALKENLSGWWSRRIDDENGLCIGFRMTQLLSQAAKTTMTENKLK